MKYLKSFNLVNESKSDNLMGFERKLLEFLKPDEVESILDLIPESIIMPIFYKGDSAKLKTGESVLITDVNYKNREYIYYYKLNGDEVYSYESDFIF